MIATTDLSTNFCGIKFSNPFILPSAQPVRTRDMIRRAFEYGWAGALTQTISKDASLIKNVQPRLHAFRVNEEIVGIMNIDLISTRSLEEWEADIKILSRDFPEQPIIASIMGDSSRSSEWKMLAERLQKAGARALELNLSCPHGMPERKMGAFIGQSPDLTYTVTKWVVSATDLPVITKLTPNVTNIVDVAVAAVQAGCSGITAINNLKCLAGVDIDRFEPLPSVNGYSTFGGYAGPGIKPVGMRCVAEIAQAIPGIPIAACGGIENWRDATEYFCVGASIAQIYTPIMEKGLNIIHDLTLGLSEFLQEKNFRRVSELIGIVLPKIVEHRALSQDYRVTVDFHNDICIRCGKCHTACEDTGFQAIQLDDQGYPIFSFEMCDGCGLCIELCPITGCIYYKR